MSKRWHVVVLGRHPGLYDSWLRAEEQVAHYRGNVHSQFSTLEEAERWYVEEVIAIAGGVRPFIDPKLVSDQFPRVPS